MLMLETGEEGAARRRILAHCDAVGRGIRSITHAQGFVAFLKGRSHSFPSSWPAVRSTRSSAEGSTF